MSAYTVPTQTPEADGTLAWNETTLVLVRTFACGISGFGYSFADIATAHLIDAHLKRAVVGGHCLNIPALWSAMVRAIRNLGRPGVCSMAISAIDNALWDLKGRLLHLSVADLLGRAHHAIPAYGSGGFTCYSDTELKKQLGGWIEAGLNEVKMKIGTDPATDGVIRADDPRMISTIKQVERRLLRNGLLMRYSDNDRPSQEGAFTSCTLWLINNYILLGRMDRAHEALDHLLSFRSDLGLYSEEINPESGEQLGNFPQALTHVALISAIRHLEGLRPGSLHTLS